jgi:hypothetical protein
MRDCDDHATEVLDDPEACKRRRQPGWGYMQGNHDGVRTMLRSNPVNSLRGLHLRDRIGNDSEEACSSIDCRHDDLLQKGVNSLGRRVELARRVIRA